MSELLKNILVAFIALACVALCRAQESKPVRVVVNGAEIHYAVKGTGESVILLHGGIGDYRSWNPQFEALATRFHVISYSRRYSYPNKNILTTDYRAAITDVDDLAALIKHLHLKRVHLVGHSYGALIALMFATKHPAMVLSLVLAEPPVHKLIRDLPGGETLYQGFFAEQEPVARAFKDNDDRLAVIRFNGLMGRSFDNLPRQVADAMMQDALTLKAINLASDPFPLRDKNELRRLKVPTLILTGEKTTKIHSAVDVELSHLLPNSRLTIVPNAGHATPIENPTFFNTVVLKFLTDPKR